jgi:arylsulfatase A-like enzyme
MPARPPNVLYLNSHDTGRWVQPYGYPVATPNLQRLAEEGMTFRQAFCAAPTCSGSRSVLLTGEYPHQNGMMGLAHRGFALRDVRHHLVHTLNAGGYRTYLLGEQHVAADPAAIGYSEVLRPRTLPYAADVAPRAADILLGAPPEPFFLDVGFFETHRTSFEPPVEATARWRRGPESIPDTPPVRGDADAFARSASAFDEGVGVVLDALDASGLAGRTLVICTTDHGLSVPRGKANLTDLGLGVLLILRGPGGFGGGRLCDALVQHLDIFPTLCDLAGLEHPSWLQGRSLLPLARDEAGEVRDAIFAELTYHVAYDPQRAVRTHRHKYVRRFSDRRRPVLANLDDGPAKDLWVAAGWGERELPDEELYDLLFDPVELDNRIADPAYADVRAELQAALERWMHETDDPLLHGPVPPPPGAELNLPDQLSPRDPTVLA